MSSAGFIAFFFLYESTIFKDIMPPTELLPLQPEAPEFFTQGVHLHAYPGLALSNIQVKIKI